MTCFFRYFIPDGHVSKDKLATIIGVPQVPCQTDGLAMARPVAPWFGEPVVSTSGSGIGARGRVVGLGARPWFPSAGSTENRWQTGIDTRAMLGMPPGPVQLPDAWVRSLSVPPSLQMTDECGWSTPMHSPRPASVPTLTSTPHAVAMGPRVRCSSSLSPRASSTSCLASGRRSVPEGPTIPLQRKAANRFHLNALSCTADVDVRNAAVLQPEAASARAQCVPKAMNSRADAVELVEPRRISHVLMERNQVAQVVDCKQGETPLHVRKNQSSEYIVYASETLVSNSFPDFAPLGGASDGSPKNSVWKRYFAENSGGHSSSGRKLPQFDEIHGPVADLNCSPSLPATAPNSERGNQEILSLRCSQKSCPALQEALDRTGQNTTFGVHEKVRERISESQDSQRGLRDVVGMFGIPVIEATDTSNTMRVEINCTQASAGDETMVAVKSRPLERRPSDATNASQKSASTLHPNVSISQSGDGQPPQVSSETERGCDSESFVPDAAQVEAITQSAAKVDAAAQNISLKHLHELRSFRQPPAAICQVAEAALSLFGINAPWSSARRRLDSQFLNKLKSFTPLEAARCPSAQVHQFLERLDAPAFSQSLDKCPGAAPLAQWCFAAAAMLLHLQPLENADGKLSRFQHGTERASKVDKTRKQVRSERLHVEDTEVHWDLGGLYVKPRLWDISSDELRCVEDLVIGREGVGHVTFYGKTDCRGLLDNLSKILSIQPGEIIVYPDATLKPDVGQGLNKPASVQLEGCMPKCQRRLTDSRAQQRYKQRVAQMTQEKGAIFEDYDPISGTWRFRVPHF